MRRMNNMSERSSDEFREALANREDKPKKKKKPLDKDMLQSAMGIKNIGDGIRHAASVYAASKKKKEE